MMCNEASETCRARGQLGGIGLCGSLPGRGCSVRALAHREDARSENCSGAAPRLVYGEFLVSTRSYGTAGVNCAYFLLSISPWIAQATGAFLRALQ